MITVQISAANSSSGNRLYVQTNANISGSSQTYFRSKQQIDPGDRDDDRQRRSLGHVHPVIEHVRARQDRREPDEQILDVVTIEQPVDRKDRERREDDRRDLCGHHRLKKPEKRYLQQVKKKVMIVVVAADSARSAAAIRTSEAICRARKFSHSS